MALGHKRATNQHKKHIKHKMFRGVIDVFTHLPLLCFMCFLCLMWLLIFGEGVVGIAVQPTLTRFG